MSRYYATLRPIGIGCYPKNYEVSEIVNFSSRKYIEDINHEAWGYIDFVGKITEKDAEAYDLIPADKKTWYGVLVTFPNDGQTKAKMYNTISSAIQPEDETKICETKTLVLTYFETESQANDFIKEINK